MKLPDVALEKLFELLGELAEDEPKAYFPCEPDLARFALSCRRFAKLFRGSFVTHMRFDSVFRFANDARDYQ